MVKEYKDHIENKRNLSPMGKCNPLPNMRAEKAWTELAIQVIRALLPILT